MSNTAVDHYGTPIKIGDWLDHIEGGLDPRRVVSILSNGFVKIDILGTPLRVEAANYQVEGS